MTAALNSNGFDSLSLISSVVVLFNFWCFFDIAIIARNQSNQYFKDAEKNLQLILIIRINIKED